jgi:hypothetical protein
MSPYTNLSNILNVLTESRAVRHEPRQPGGGRLLFAATANSQFAAKLLQGDVDYAFAVLICERFDLSGYRRPKSAALRASIGGRS